MEFRLLGPVEVRSGEVSVPLGGAKPRTLLAALLLERGRLVPAGRLVDLIWGDDPPETARALVQTYVASLRRAFAAAGLPDDVIVTRPPGYAIEVPADTVDLEVFRRLLRKARAASEPAPILREALALWRGPALSGLERTRLAGEAARLEAMRLTATEERIAADLAAGHHDRLLAELTALVHEHPVNERLRAQLMVTLTRLGRRSDALASYAECRERLAEELGVDPGPELQGLQLAVLRGDPDPRPAPHSEVPRQLPHLTNDFTGREAHIERLLKTPGIRVITGAGGTGKSTLATKVCHDLAPSLPDGQLYAELRGMSDTPAEPAEILGRFLRALGVEPERIPDGAGERAEMYRTLLAGRRMLVLLDDAGGEQQVQPLLPGSPGCAVVITSRHRLGGLPGARPVELDVMAPAEALAFLSTVIGEERVAAQREAAEQMVAHCGWLPLAIRVAAARLANRPRMPLSWLADRIADESHRLNELSPGDAGMRASIGLSYESLDTQAKRAFERVGYFGVPDFAPWVITWLTGQDGQELAERLVDAQLLEFAGPDRLGTLRYRMHDLVRLYARERAELAETNQELSRAIARVLGGWLAVIAETAAEAPGDDVRWPHTITEPPMVQTPRIDDPRAWFEAEQKCMVAGVERAAALGLHDLACAFTPEQYSMVFAGPDRLAQRTRVIDAVLAAARREGDLRVEAIMLADYGLLHYLRDEYAEARLDFFHALSRFRELGDSLGEAATLARLGTTCREAGRLSEGLHFLDRAAALFGTLGEQTGIAYARRLSGSLRLEQGAYAQALSDFQAALIGYRRMKSQRGEGLTLRSLSLHHRAKGELDEAVRYGLRSREIFRALGDVFLESYAVRAIAKARLRMGQPQFDELHWALAVGQDLKDRWGQGVTMRVIGEAHLATGELDEAMRWLEEAAALWRKLEAPLWLARTQRDIALVHAANNDRRRAAEVLGRAMTAFHDHGSREYAELKGLTEKLQG
ncbi:MAG TPA: BTAD domain-containing putative transcriptional regulator [Candidatus Limnocylindrales bacterium]|nr:BTAD domain-containing putative transcriptional regulator [Candidatus Limnocylindrales bacterium]